MPRRPSIPLFRLRASGRGRLKGPKGLEGPKVLALALAASLLAMMPGGQPRAQTGVVTSRIDGLIVRLRTTADGVDPGVVDKQRTVGSSRATTSDAVQSKAIWWWPWWPGDRPRPGQPGSGGSDGTGDPGDSGSTDDTGGTGGTSDNGGTGDNGDPGGNDAGNSGTGGADSGDTNGGGTSTGPSAPPAVEPAIIVALDPATGRVADPVAVTEAVSSRSGIALTFTRHAADGSLVMQLPSSVSADQARDVAQRLMADPAVLSVTPDFFLRPTSVNDPMYGQQWSIRGLDSSAAGIGTMNVTPLWSLTRGRTAAGNPVVVAVLDSGSTGHPDLNAAWLGGHDFVSASADGSSSLANDGDGRDADPSDPGNACPEAGAPSNWHGTAVAGIIAAAANNGYGIAGAAPEARILPLRVLGRCGGRLSDTLDAMQWAAGLSVPGVPDNPYPARVINLSLATDGGEPCTSDTSSLVQDVVDRVLARGVLIVAAAGNDGGLTSYPQATGAIGLPGNCRGVLTVAAHTHSGDLAAYSSFGARVGLTAPGGAGGGGTGCKRQNGIDCRIESITTTINTGSDAPAAPDFTSHFVGTSAAAPHVSAAAALLFAIRPEASPQDVITAMTSTARPWPASTFCRSAEGQGLCGSGMLDAQAAAMHLMTAPHVEVEAPGGTFAGSSTVTLGATGSSEHYDPATLDWHWRQVSGPVVTLAAGQGPRATVTLPPTRSQVVIEVSATDPAGLSTFVNIVLEVNNRPVAPQIATQHLMSGAALALSVAGVDADGDPIRYALIRAPAGMTVDAKSGGLSWPAAVAGTHTIVLALTDAYGARADDLVFDIVVETESNPGPDQLAPPTSKGGGGASGLVDAALFAAILVVARLRRRPPLSRAPRVT